MDICLPASWYNDGLSSYPQSGGTILHLSITTRVRAAMLTSNSEMATANRGDRHIEVYTSNSALCVRQSEILWL